MRRKTFVEVDRLRKWLEEEVRIGEDTDIEMNEIKEHEVQMKFD